MLTMDSRSICHFIFMMILLEQGINGDEIRLDQSSAVIRGPRETVKISCKISGFTMTSYYMHWIRQKPGKALEWIGRVNSGSVDYADTMKNHFTLSEDVSQSTQYLEAKTLREEDTAVYYCARLKGPNWAFDYWGSGTKVSVTNTQESAPKSIVHMTQCTPDSDGFLTIGCMTRGFSPADSLTFKWKDPDNKEFSDFVQYPAFGPDGDYTKISHMRVKKSDWDPKKPYTCEASNSKGSLEGPPVPQPQPPQTFKAKFALTLKPPFQKQIFLNDRIILEAVVSGDIKETVESASVSCSVNTAGISVGPGNFEFSSDISIKKYNVTVDTKKWFDGAMVTCTTSDTNNKDIKQTISFDKGDGKTPDVTIYKPDNMDKSTQRVSHVCEVTSTKLGNIYIMWTVDNGPYIEGLTSAPIHQKDSTTVLSILTMTKQEYEHLKTTITCAVIHASMRNRRSPLQVSTSKSEPPEPENGFALDCNKDVLEEDEFRSLWSTATSFIFLFLFSLTYSAVLSFCKVKQR